MNIKKFLVSSAAGALLFGSLAVGAMANNGHTPKTTGDVYLHAGVSDTHIVYNAFQGDESTAKGSLTWDRTGDYANHIVGNVIQANVSGDNASFVIYITESTNYPSWVGEKLQFNVYNGGTPGAGKDTVSWQWNGPTITSGAYGEPVVGGNLNVFDY